MVKIKDICNKIQSGGTPKSSNLDYYEGGNIKRLNTKEVDFNRIYDTEKKITKLGYDNSSTKMITENNVIIAMYGATAGKVAINKVPLCTNQACCNLEINSNIADYNYVYYYLCHNYSNLARLANGGAQQNLNSLIIKDFDIDLPSIEKQKKISTILCKIDNKIELNNQINHNLYTLCINHLKELIGRNEGNETLISNYGKIQGGFAFKSKDLLDEITDNQVIKIKNITGLINIDIKDSQYITSTLAEKTDNKFRLNKGEVVVAMTGAEIGKTGFIYGDTNYYLNQRVGVTRGYSKEKELFLNVLFLSTEFQDKLHEIGHGSAQPNMSTSDIENLKVANVGDDALEIFYNKHINIYQKLILNCEQNEKLKDLRDTLLPKLMNGEINLDSVTI